jgi:hypothetical protein
MKKFIVVICILAALVFSCILEEENPAPAGDPIDAAGVEKETFYVQSFKTGGSTQTAEAGLLGKGKYCNVWVGRGTGVKKSDADKIAKIFDDDIYEKMMYYFSFEDLDFAGDTIANTMEVVKYLVDKGNGKLDIVLVDIQDNYQQGVNNAYVAGYFYAGDLFERDPGDSRFRYSNERAVIFIDTYPAVPGSEECNCTLAHEMQHLMSFLNFAVLNRTHEFSVWIDEGLSLSAEWLYLEKQLTSRVNHYKNDPSGLIKKGNNFFIWGNRLSESVYATLDDYSTAYLFFQWLRLQSDIDIYWEIMMSNSYDQTAVVKAYNEISGKSETWESLLKSWFAANQLNSTAGIYGYKGEINDVKAHAAPAAASINLFPGEGVYSETSSQPNTSGSGTNIRYAYITPSTVDSGYSAGSTLLTYNVSTNEAGAAERGVTTGAASVSVVPDARFIQSLYNEPIRIDARDMIGLDKWRNSYADKLGKGAR